MGHKIKGNVRFYLLLPSEVKLKYQQHLLKQLVCAEETELSFAFKFLVFLTVLVRIWHNLSSKQGNLLLIQKKTLYGLRQI